MEVDIAQVLKSKNPSLYRWTPGFVVSYLKRILHQEEVNYVLRNFAHLPPIEFVRATLKYMGISYRAAGMEKLDPGGRYIFASNHPFGGMDGLMLADEVEKYFGDVKLVVNDLLMNLEPLSPLFIPINKHGRQSARYAKAYNDAFVSATPIITFPSGLCSRRKKGVVCDLEWKGSFIKKAVASERDVVPVFFKGELSNFFYRLSNLRKSVGIKANIEMLYLADEMFKQKGKHFDIIIGEPVWWQSLARHTDQKRLAEAIRIKAYNLKK